MNKKNIGKWIIILVLLIFACIMGLCTSCTSPSSKMEKSKTIITKVVVPEYAKLFRFKLIYPNDSIAYYYVYSKDRFDAERIIIGKYTIDNDTTVKWEEGEVEIENKPFVVKTDSVNEPALH